MSRSSNSSLNFFLLTFQSQFPTSFRQFPILNFSDLERTVSIDFVKFSYLGIQNWWNRLVKILQVRPFGYYEIWVLLVFYYAVFFHPISFFSCNVMILKYISLGHSKFLSKHQRTSIRRNDEILTFYNSFNQSQGSRPFVMSLVERSVVDRTFVVLAYIRSYVSAAEGT